MESGKPIAESVDNGSLRPQSLDENDNPRDDDQADPLTAPKCPPGCPPGCLPGGGRRRGSRKSNPWLAHVKDTMKKNRGVSFKNVLKLAKKSFKNSKYGSKSKSKSHSQSQSAGRRRRSKHRENKSSKSSQNGGSGMAGKAPFGENAAPVV